MNQRSSAPARVFAAIALVCGFLVVIAIVAGSLGDGDDEPGDRSRPAQTTGQSAGDGTTPKAYVVQNGDTLTSIANKTGVPVSQIEALNPGVDPQILVSGEKLKLR